MSYEEVQAFLESKVSYKPGYKFFVRRLINMAFIEVRFMTAPLPDADGTDSLSAVVHSRTINEAAIAKMDEDYFKHLAIEMIRRHEEHEMDEWLRIHGTRVREPHGPDIR